MLSGPFLLPLLMLLAGLMCYEAVQAPRDRNGYCTRYGIHLVMPRVVGLHPPPRSPSGLSTRAMPMEEVLVTESISAQIGSSLSMTRR